MKLRRGKTEGLLKGLLHHGNGRKNVGGAKLRGTIGDDVIVFSDGVFEWSTRNRSCPRQTWGRRVVCVCRAFLGVPSSPKQGSGCERATRDRALIWLPQGPRGPPWRSSFLVFKSLFRPLLVLEKARWTFRKEGRENPRKEGMHSHRDGEKGPCT